MKSMEAQTTALKDDIRNLTKKLRVCRQSLRSPGGAIDGIGEGRGRTQATGRDIAFGFADRSTEGLHSEFAKRKDGDL